MSYKFKYTDRIVGLFIIIAILIVILSLISITVNKQFFLKKHIYKSLFVDAQGITTKTPISFKGFTIGEIKNFKLNKDNYIEAEFVIFGDYYSKIVENSILRKTMNPITSRSTIELIQGPDITKIADELSLIPELTTPEGRQLISRANIQISGDMLSSIMGNINLFLHNLNQDENSESGSFFRLIYHLANSSDELEKAMKGSQEFISKINRAYQQDDGDFFLAINQFKNIGEKLYETTESLNILLANSNELINNYKNPDSMLIKLVDPDSELIVNPLNEILHKLAKSLDDIQHIILYLQSQTPEISTILLESKTTLGTARKTLEGINNNPLIRRGIPKDIRSDIPLGEYRPVSIEP